MLTWCEDSQAGQGHHLPDPVPGEAAVRALIRHPHTLDLQPACHFILLGAASELQNGGISVSTCSRSKRESVPQSPESPVSAGNEVPGLLWQQPCYFLFILRNKEAFPDPAGLQLCLQAAIMVRWPGVEDSSFLQPGRVVLLGVKILSQTLQQAVGRLEGEKDGKGPQCQVTPAPLAPFIHSTTVSSPFGAWLGCVGPLPLPTPS